MEGENACEAPGPYQGQSKMMGAMRKKEITTKRRKQLLHLASEMAQWMDDRQIEVHERRLFQEMTWMMFGD